MLKRTKALLALDLLARSSSYDELMNGPITARSGLESLAATFRRFRKRIAQAGPGLDHEVVNRIAEGLMDEMQVLVEGFATTPADQIGAGFWRIETGEQRLRVAVPDLSEDELNTLLGALLSDIQRFAHRFLEIERSGVPQDSQL